LVFQTKEARSLLATRLIKKGNPMENSFDDLITRISNSPTIEESFLIFLDDLLYELDDIYTNSDNHDLRNLINLLKNRRIPLSQAMASNISFS
jgi:hypothetical protein